MTPEQIRLVQDSFNEVIPISDQAAELFYGRLFSENPQFKALFSGDMQGQGKKLMQHLNMVVRGLNKIEQIAPAVQSLGRKHVDYGVKPEDYAAVGQALIWTLEQGLGRNFTPEVRDAWLAAYQVLATTMIEAASHESKDAA